MAGSVSTMAATAALAKEASGWPRRHQARVKPNAVKKKAAEGVVMSDDERRKLVSTEQSLGMAPEPKMPSGLEIFGADEKEESPADFSDAESFFNLPHGEDDEEEDH